MIVITWIKRIFGTLWRVINQLARLVQFALLLLMLMFIAVALTPPQVRVPEAAVLVLAPEGTIVEELSGDPLERAFAAARGSALDETRLKDMLDAVRAAKEDERIKALYLHLDGLGGAGLSKLQELADEILSFRQSGKPVIAAGDSYTRNQYYLAAQADEIYMHPMGFVLIEGYSRYMPYFKSALDALQVDFHVWSAGEYKSFVETVTRDDMSPEDRAASASYLQGLWRSYQADVTAARELPGDALQRYADEAVFLLEEAGGDTAALARNYGLVDTLAARDEVRARLRQIVGANEDDDGDFASIGFDDYLRSRRESPRPASIDKLAVVVASGQILDGHQPPGLIGGDSLAELIRRAGRDERVKALVLRVDSPGGSALASEVALRELEAFRASGRPWVVSMGSVAASGGYWIAMGADEIWASPTTLTGSIGVFAMFPTFSKLLDRLGIHVDGIGTTRLAGQFDVTRELGPDADELLQQSIEHAYELFVSKVAESRNTSFAAIDQVARGRVWVGSDAFERGLVDSLGNLEDAIASAAGRAGLEAGDYIVEYVERPQGLLERLVLQYTTVLAPAEAWLSGKAVPRWQGWIESIMPSFETLGAFNDPRGMYAYCFCEVL